MMEFYLTQPYNSLEEMVNSDEVKVYKEDLKFGTYEKYAIVSRVGNRYDLEGNKIEDFVDNPFFNASKTEEVEEDEEDFVEIFEEEDDDEEGEEIMNKYEIVKRSIKDLVEDAIEKTTVELNVKHEKEIKKLKEEHEQEIAELKAFHESELATAKANAKTEAKEELLARLKD